MNSTRAYREPLRAAMEINTLSISADRVSPRHLTTSVPDPIDQSIRVDRVAAAENADEDLFQATRFFRMEPRNPEHSLSLAEALSAWALTRSALGLPLDAVIAIQHALQWGIPSAEIYLRSAGVFSEVRSTGRQRELRLLESALHQLTVAEAPPEAVAKVLLAIANLELRYGQYFRISLTLSTVEKRLAERQESSLRFEIYRVRLLSCLRRGTPEALLEADSLPVIGGVSTWQKLDAAELRGRDSKWTKSGGLILY